MSILPFIEGEPIAGRQLIGQDLAWLTTRRQAGIERFQKTGLPTQKLESCVAQLNSDFIRVKSLW